MITASLPLSYNIHVGILLADIIFLSYYYFLFPLTMIDATVCVRMRRATVIFMPPPVIIKNNNIIIITVMI